jgi:pantoate--beta-alanine ligase
MKIIKKKIKLISILKNEKKVGFVPTMGAIHNAHISLIKRSKKECNKTIVSIFVNKPQFNRFSDFKKYPKPIKRDIYLLKKTKIDYLYLPTENQIYTKGKNDRIKLHPFSKRLCGKFRPNHFKAVVDVIDKFIQIINPSKIYLGKKDFQQLHIVRDYVKKNYKKIKIIGCKIIREKNGIPMSSRNLLLNLSQKKIASSVYMYLLSKKKDFSTGKISVKKIKNKLFLLGVKKLEYIELININKIITPFKKKKNYKIFIAYYLSKVRLIDNI